ncbi:penicillin-binding protein 2 [Thiomicrospira sp. WB1]|uniref:peptidoglycan D,D-transpeptidase FtsI family protein n=1 Tax=Thiomicrospira sp. WB1 TaxID=1685380 RepID=UPI0007469AB1|nr:penicillin-binding protein 2 [Thiomicrospira sp. WB1]KUJ71379.1 peptidoglycan glycosyltransferase [Thiomicrospira sp. WB1]
MKQTLRKRDQVILGLMLMVFIALVVRAFYVQILQADFLQSEGSKRQVRTMDLAAPRGDIVDRHGRLLALSTPVNTVWLDPKVVTGWLAPDPLRKQEWTEKEQERVTAYQAGFRTLLQWLKLSEPGLTPQILAQKHRRFMYVKRQILPTLGERIRDLALPGVYVDSAYKRYYPAGEVAAHLVGFNDIDDRGIAGIEKIYHDWLSGKPGKKQVIRDRTGRVVHFVKDLEPAKIGQDLVLSIDQDLQFFLYHRLKRLQIAHQAATAMSVILDAKTGEVLAMASVPGFNPNDRSQLQGKKLRNRPVTDRLEPGSTVKPFVVAKALDQGRIQPDTVIETGNGRMRVQGEVITDTHAHGDLTPMEVLQRSSNVGAAKIALTLEPQQQWQMYHDIGFAQDTGLFLPGEIMGYIKPAREWQSIDQTSSAFGYGFNINLLQLAQAYLIFTNQGAIKPLSVIKLDEPPQGKQVVSPESAQQVLRMLESVTEPGGTAPQAQIEGYRVAGKTGTVHLSQGGGYAANRYAALFAGVVPVDHPRFIMATAVVDPSRGVYYGGKLIGPVFQSVMSEALRLYQVPPDAHTRPKKLAPASEADTPVEEIAPPPGQLSSQTQEATAQGDRP